MLNAIVYILIIIAYLSATWWLVTVSEDRAFEEGFASGYAECFIKVSENFENLGILNDKMTVSKLLSRYDMSGNIMILDDNSASSENSKIFYGRIWDFVEDDDAEFVDVLGKSSWRMREDWDRIGSLPVSAVCIKQDTLVIFVDSSEGDFKHERN